MGKHRLLFLSWTLWFLIMNLLYVTVWKSYSSLGHGMHGQASASASATATAREW